MLQLLAAFFTYRSNHCYNLDIGKLSRLHPHDDTTVNFLRGSVFFCFLFLINYMCHKTATATFQIHTSSSPHRYKNLEQSGDKYWEEPEKLGAVPCGRCMFRQQNGAETSPRLASDTAALATQLDNNTTGATHLIGYQSSSSLLSPSSSWSLFCTSACRRECWN